MGNAPYIQHVMSNRKNKHSSMSARVYVIVHRNWFNRDINMGAQIGNLKWKFEKGSFYPCKLLDMLYRIYHKNHLWYSLYFILADITKL